MTAYNPGGPNQRSVEGGPAGGIAVTTEIHLGEGKNESKGLSSMGSHCEHPSKQPFHCCGGGTFPKNWAAGCACTTVCHFLLWPHFLGGLQGFCYFLNKRMRNHTIGLKGWAEAVPRPSVGRPGLFSQDQGARSSPLPRQGHLRAASPII